MSAPQVCATCKKRKKRCDKRIPRCSYCAQRDIDCSYEYGTRPTSYTSSITTPGSGSESAGEVAALGDSRVLSEERPHGYDRPPLVPPVQPFPLAPILDPTYFHTTSALAIFRIIDESGRSIEDISLLYFNGIHLWIPFFCPGRFRKDVLCYHSQPTAEFSLLLLCMCLLTQGSAPKPGRSTDHAMLYFYAKSFLAQLLAVLPTSIQLIQAGLFISMYEYATLKSDQALMTIDTCIRIAYELGIHKKPECPGWNEGWNTWWGLRIFERIFYCDATTREAPLISTAPNNEDLLPHEVDELAWEQRLGWSGTLTPLRVTGVGCLGRAAQAVWLLDRVVEVIASDPRNLSNLMALDGELQQLLSITMDKCQGRRGGHCGAVGTAIRALFILHQSILHNNRTPIDAQVQQHSEAALNTVAQMVVDVARSHREIPENDVDIISPISRYIIRYALDHLYKTRYEDQKKWFQDVDALRESLAKLATRWPAEERVQLRD
ncbi:hypothetical protein FB567DRAFT_75897 [Paraphoma chrysanthemicola]|uniref:Zn(2)-C6 fungal-type domain-containing protein n=1 Tax=Paraphoma chrysanthemicola TaxID=798071 RepID=A0A8K0VWS8_9PLEO|nr:hypothetical protein FB567DRAFT_75897 [Paraphoma chrysanthemicola]